MTVTDEGAAALLRTSHYSDAPASSMRRIAVPAHPACSGYPPGEPQSRHTLVKSQYRRFPAQVLEYGALHSLKFIR